MSKITVVTFHLRMVVQKQVALPILNMPLSLLLMQNIISSIHAPSSGTCWMHRAALYGNSADACLHKMQLNALIQSGIKMFGFFLEDMCVCWIHE